MTREVTGNKLAGFVDVCWRLLVVVALLALGFLILNPVPRASAASFYPACLKADGDWVHGVTARECELKPPRGLGGRHYPVKWFKKVQRGLM